MTDLNLTRCAVFIDRDGVVVKGIVREGLNFPTAPRALEEFELILGAAAALELLGQNGFVRILVSNQPDRARGLISQDAWRAIQNEVEKLPFDDIRMCPHRTEDNCSCKKPKPGMLMEAARAWNIDLRRSYFIGDSATDMAAAAAAGSKSILISAPYNEGIKSDYRALHFFAAAELIIKLQHPL